MAACSSILAWENPMDREAWWATVHRVPESQTRLSTHKTFPILKTEIQDKIQMAHTHTCTHTRTHTLASKETNEPIH